jgi:hypothetical protein
MELFSYSPKNWLDFQKINPSRNDRPTLNPQRPFSTNQKSTDGNPPGQTGLPASGRQGLPLFTTTYPSIAFNAKAPLPPANLAA